MSSLFLFHQPKCNQAVVVIDLVPRARIALYFYVKAVQTYYFLKPMKNPGEVSKQSAVRKLTVPVNYLYLSCKTQQQKQKKLSHVASPIQKCSHKSTWIKFRLYLQLLSAFSARPQISYRRTY